MVRYIVAVILACVYLAGSIWVVSSQGQAYRDSLSKQKLAATEHEKPVLPPPEETAKSNRAVVAPERIAPQAVEEPDPVAIADSSPAPEVTPQPREKTPAERAEAEPKTSPDLKPVTAESVNPFAKNDFWNRPHLTKVWPLSHLKPDDEVRLGAELHDLIVHFNPLVEDDPRIPRLYELAEPLLKNVHRKEFPYKFFVVNSEAVNAFSHPGGYVYVSRGLLDLIGDDKDYALQFAIGHEIAHVDRQHAIRCLQDPDVEKMNMGTLQKLYGLIIPLGYLDSNKVVHDFQADEWVASQMLLIERSRRETLNFLQILDGYARSHGFWNGHARPEVNASPIENHYRAGTATWQRLKHLKEFIAEASKARK